MIFEIIKNIIISIIIITSLHYLYIFLINELTIKTSNNILHEEIYEYKKINNILNKPIENNIIKKNRGDKQMEDKNIKDNLKLNLEKDTMEENLKEYYNQINNIKD